MYTNQYPVNPSERAARGMRAAAALDLLPGYHCGHDVGIDTAVSVARRRLRRQWQYTARWPVSFWATSHLRVHMGDRQLQLKLQLQLRRAPRVSAPPPRTRARS